MTGSTRLKIVLSGLYWAMIAAACLISYEADMAWEGWLGAKPLHSATYDVLFILGCAAAFYLTVAALWWAFAGFGRGRRPR